jgi:hypothetical protein
MYTSIQKNWWNISFVEMESSKLIIPQVMCWSGQDITVIMIQKSNNYYVWEHDGLGCS